MVSGQSNSHQLFRRMLAVAFLCSSSYLLAHTVNAWVADSLTLPIDSSMSKEVVGQAEPILPASEGNSQQLARDILTSGLFLLPPPPQSESATVSAGPPPPPLNVSSKIALIGVVMGIGGNERAILEEVASKKQALYRVSQHIPEVGELAVIEKDRVLFREGSREEWLDLAIVKQTASAGRFPLPEQGGWAASPVLPVVQPAPGPRSIDRAQLAQLVSNPQSYMTEARFQPHFAGNGQFDGFRVDGIRQVGVLEKAGLLNEDVLAGINGIEIRDPGKLWEVFKQLQYERRFRLNVVRQSQPLTLVVEIRG